MRSVTVEGLFIPKRIDAYLAGRLEHEYSRTRLKEALLAGKILLNGKPAKPREMVQNEDEIQLDLAPVEAYKPLPEKTALSIIYQDKDIMVIDKPAGMVVHPGAGNKKGTLVNALLGSGASLSDTSGPMRPGIVHRLDKDTSGLLLVAKNNAAHVALQEQFAMRSLLKIYLALVKGRVEFDQGRIEEPMARHPHLKEKMAVSREEHAKPAETHYKVLKRFKEATLLEVKILTGRTHQIRVHLAHLGNPVLGDSVYGSKWRNPATGLPAGRQALHAAKIEFSHPKNDKLMKFESPLPEDFKQMLSLEEAK